MAKGNCIKDYDSFGIERILELFLTRKNLNSILKKIIQRKILSILNLVAQNVIVKFATCEIECVYFLTHFGK